MNIRLWSLLIIALYLSSACAAAPVTTLTRTPIRIPSPTSLPTAALESPLLLLPSPQGDRYAPPDVPACRGAKLMDEPIKFSWESTAHSSTNVGFSNVPESKWTYYRCNESRAALSAFYRQFMPKPPYHWLEMDVEARNEGTLAVYNNSPVRSSTQGYRWVYLWFLPEKSDDLVSYLVAAWWDAPHSC